MTSTLAGKLIHVGQYVLPKSGKRLLFLRQKDPTFYAWYERQQDNSEVETVLGATNTEEALRLAHKNWKIYFFQTIICGFRYSLPERDEHGSNALFHQMVSSYSTSNGVYFDQDVGHNCYVQAASQEALSLWHELKKEGKLVLS